MTEVDALRAYRRDVFVALRRDPERARELRKWERAVADAGTIDEARRASDEVGKLLDTACREVHGA
ncbi:hypothetical protein SSOG_03199 [Streptomyces himastatinicus ATCC 53653]|uniref:Uncharacterized protein n=1 Tax=Streptomyces himastatinicus ATCC 53653 TaxID=457427 RepID=D9WIA2_9ACTN|nr:hypothetical protein [Streptomyces himastatinicus]EFL23485.1 hypothetical protein SSOG_03199 [Streptomyces himastatinicus ATCC 53653]